ncbi:MAG TPA: hypothetical protein VHW23_36815, partial [Kofleriaceae bacterium]|nr:hypothetical protein [Kofleriaceae bacterium]
MRHVTFSALLAVVGLGAGGRVALATPFEPATIPDQVDAVGHLDVDALRRTQVFAAAGGQAALDAALEEAPPKVRPVVRALAATLRGVSFWHAGDDHGAVYLETRDAKSLGQLVGRLPATPAQPIDGFPTYTITEHDKTDKTHLAGIYGDTMVLADSEDGLRQSLRVLAGRAANLAGSKALPMASRQGVFVFVAIGDHLLGSIQKTARARMLQLSMRSLVVDVGESAGQVTAIAHAEMRSADAGQKATSILEGLRAMASLSDDPMAHTLLDG